LTIANQHFQILIIGGGTGGIMTASQLIRQKKYSDIGIIEMADKHYYQPAFTLVGAGTYSWDNTSRSMASVMPREATWIKDKAVKLNPDNNTVVTEKSGEISYDYLVLSAGVVYDKSLVPGLEETWDKGVVCSNYTDPRHTWEVVKNFKGGTALFTQPTTPIKCGGAPQKALYMSESAFQKSGVRAKTTLVFATNGTVIFGIPEIKKTLMEVVDRKDIDLRFGHELVKIDAGNQIAWYRMSEHENNYNTKDGVEIEKDGELTGIHFDMLHTAPPCAAPDFIRNSSLASANKWLDVDLHTLQHNHYPNVFGVGDVADLPTAKTGAAIRKQVPIVVDNIDRLIRENQIGTGYYNGYSSCPLVTDYGKMVMAEFDYDNNFTPDPMLKYMLIRDSSKEHWRLWILKKYILPYLYWNKMMKGKNV